MIGTADRLEAFRAQQQRRRRHVQCGRQLQEVSEADVALATLDPADVGAVQAATIRERRLGEIRAGPQLPDRQTESAVGGRDPSSWLGVVNVGRIDRHMREYPHVPGVAELAA